VQLLMHHLALRGEYHTATLLIHPDNERSLALAARNRFVLHSRLDDNCYYKRPIPPLTYTDGVVMLRRPRVDDIDRLGCVDGALVLAHQGDQLVGVELGARPWHDEGLDCLAPPVVGDADHRRHRHAGVRAQDVLDFARVHVEAA
jgi:hypothetical protein